MARGGAGVGMGETVGEVAGNDVQINQVLQINLSLKLNDVTFAFDVL